MVTESNCYLGQSEPSVLTKWLLVLAVRLASLVTVAHTISVDDSGKPVSAGGWHWLSKELQPYYPSARTVSSSQQKAVGTIHAYKKSPKRAKN